MVTEGELLKLCWATLESDGEDSSASNSREVDVRLANVDAAIALAVADDNSSVSMVGTIAWGSPGSSSLMLQISNGFVPHSYSSSSSSSSSDSFSCSINQY